MLDTVGPELQVVNKSEIVITLEENASVVLTPDQGKEATNEVLPINFNGLAKASILLILSHNSVLNLSGFLLPCTNEGLKLFCAFL